MEEAVARPRYTRRTAPGRRYKRAMGGNGRLLKIVVRQLLIALVMLLAAGIVKSINSPVTNFMSEKVRFVLTQNLELKSIYNYVDNAIIELKNSIAPGPKVSGQANAGGEENGSTGTSAPSDPENTIETYNQTAAGNAKQPESSVLSASFVEDARTSSVMLTPVSGILSSHFGERTDPFSSNLKFHEGVDIDAARGAGIEAALDGTVEEAGSSPSYGKYIKLGHAGGFETIYAHCSELDVKKGMAVKQGDTIAKVGDSGASVGVHLHFEVLKDGIPVDPLEYIALSAGEVQN